MRLFKASIAARALLRPFLLPECILATVLVMPASSSTGRTEEPATSPRPAAGISEERRPIGSFIFLGPTGVGKTELAKALADFMFNDEKAIVRHSDTGEEINVLRDRSGKIIYAVKNENGYLAATINGTGHPVEIKPNPKTVHDAGKGTAWALRRLIDAGYFNIKKSFN